jgi:RNA polymerase sigma-70 factor, ECF subfamily
MPKEDKQLINEYKKGDVEAFGILVEKYKRPLFGFILGMVHNTDEAENIFQETWIKAIKNIHTYKHKKFISWLFKISHNLVIDQSRKKKEILLSMDAPDKDGHSLSDFLKSAENDPIKNTVREEETGKIYKAVYKLPEQQREVFMLRMSADLTFKEIAKIQKVTINTALARMQYALKNLRKELQKDFNGEINNEM